jgi:malic enzyme
VLGLGDIGPEAGLPVMEGKALLFKFLGEIEVAARVAAATGAKAQAQAWPANRSALIGSIRMRLPSSGPRARPPAY